MDEYKDLNNKIVEFKNHLETIPELAWNEDKTKQYIISQLGSDYCWSEKTALIYKLGNGPAIFFRTEIDALNTNLGPKHVCGHSSHTAALMGVYLYLKNHPPKDKTIYFIFQPSEEGYPSGAQFIQTQFLNKHRCEIGFAFHTFPSKKKGEIMNIHWASGDYFEIVIQGKGTHIKNKYVKTTHDVLFPACYLSKKINTLSFKNSIINVGILSVGETPNSIAEKAMIKGDIRSLDEKTRKSASIKLKELFNDTKKKFPQFTYNLFVNKAYPILQNDTKTMRLIKDLLPLSKNKIISFATEDFSLYKGKTIFLLVGTGEKTELHEVKYNVSNSVMQQLYIFWIKLASFSLAKTRLHC